VQELLAAVAAGIGDRPFMVMSSDGHGPDQLGGLMVPAAVVDSVTGATPTDRVIVAQRAYVGAFFDRWLCDRDNHLLDGPSAEYPEVSFF
jgi:hypothetical protein